MHTNTATLVPFCHLHCLCCFALVTSVCHIFLTCCSTSYSASSSLVVLAGVVCWGMRTNSFIAEHADGGEGGRMKEREVYMLKQKLTSHHTEWVNLSVWKLTCLGGLEADDKRLSGKSIDISRSIIWVLILASDCHCVSPESIQTKSLQPMMLSYFGAKQLRHRYAVHLTYKQIHTAPGMSQICPVSHWLQICKHVHCHTCDPDRRVETNVKTVAGEEWSWMTSQLCCSALIRLWGHTVLLSFFTCWCD